MCPGKFSTLLCCFIFYLNVYTAVIWQCIYKWRIQWKIKISKTSSAVLSTAQGKRSSFRTYGKIYVSSWEQRGCSLAIVIIWEAALQKQLARVHDRRREEGRQGKVRTLYNYMIHMEVWKTMETEFENFQISETMGITHRIYCKYNVFFPLNSSSAMHDKSRSF